jgi:RNA polymerase sigma factor (sigma-70 family)
MHDSRDASTPESSDVTAEKLQEFREPLKIFAARRLRDWPAAEDVAQETLTRALEALRAGRLENPAALSGYLFQTALHVCIHRFRSADRERRALERLRPRDAGDDNDILGKLVSAEYGARLRKALETLEPDQRRLLEMTYRDELDSEAIGRELGVSPDAVRARRHRAIRRLAQALGVTRGPDGALEK